jgi:hypothetical protein
MCSSACHGFLVITGPTADADTATNTSILRHCALSDVGWERSERCDALL